MKTPSLALLLIGCGLLTAGLRGAETPIETVLRIDSSRLQAMMAGDGAALARVFSDELIFVHSDGRLETKAEYVRNLLAGDTAYEGAMTSGVRAMQVAPEVVVVIGAQEMRKRLRGAWSEIKLRFMAVWRNEAGVWRMAAWQSMRPAGNSTVPPK
jgi:ketosteroid isomerase-like protein